MDAVKFVKGSTDQIEGLAIPFGGPVNGRDLEGEMFTKDTDLALDWFPHGRPALYDHGKDRDVGLEVIGRQIKAIKTDAGVWAITQLNRAHRYAEFISDLVSDGKLYHSSGSMAHLIQRTGGVIKRWPWVELSFTPTPANFYAITGHKAAEAHIKSLGLEVPEAIKTGADDDARIRAMAERDGTKGAALVRALEAALPSEGDDRADAIARMASAAGISVSTVMQILRAEIDHPPRERLAGFARSLGIPLSRLVDAVVRDGANRELYGRSTRNLDLEAAVLDAELLLMESGG